MANTENVNGEIARGQLHRLVRRFCGCWEGEVSCKWGRFDGRKPRDAARYRLCRCIEWLCDRPHVIRWRGANVLARWSHRLRGGRSYDIGWGVQGNRAAMLEDALKMHFIPSPDGMEDSEAEEMLDRLDELGRLAKATSWVDDQ